MPARWSSAATSDPRRDARASGLEQRPHLFGPLDRLEVGLAKLPFVESGAVDGVEPAALDLDRVGLVLLMVLQENYVRGMGDQLLLPMSAGLTVLGLAWPGGLMMIALLSGCAGRADIPPTAELSVIQTQAAALVATQFAMGQTQTALAVVPTSLPSFTPQPTP